MRSAGAVLSRRADTIRGERKASGASSRTCRSTLPSRRAIAAKLAARPYIRSSIQMRALAIATSRASRRSSFMGVLCAGTWTMPLTLGGSGLVQGIAIVLMSELGLPDELFAPASGSCGVSSTLSRRRTLISFRGQGDALEVAFDKMPIAVGQLLTGATGAEVIA